MTWAGESFDVAVAEPTELQERLRSVRPPPAVLGRERERRLTDRQRQILDHLGQMFDGGFAHLTMAEIASRSNCSLRTLYGLAPSRDELVLIVVDRNLWRVGRTAVTSPPCRPRSGWATSTPSTWSPSRDACSTSPSSGAIRLPSTPVQLPG
jgi:hypothetical protein